MHLIRKEPETKEPKEKPREGKNRFGVVTTPVKVTVCTNDLGQWPTKK